MLDIAKLQSRGVICAPNVALTGDISFEAPVRLYAGANMRFGSLGAYSYVAPNTTLNHATIGRFVSIGNDCELGPSYHPVDWLSTSPAFYEDVFGLGTPPMPGGFDKLKPVVVGSDVWIGSRAAIMGGVSIGHGAVIGYGAVVTRDVPPYAIVGGVPAKIIRYRFDETVIARLLAFGWWNYDVVAARKAGLELDWTEPMAALDALERARDAGTLPAFDPSRIVRLSPRG